MSFLSNVTNKWATILIHIGNERYFFPSFRDIECDTSDTIITRSHKMILIFLFSTNFCFDTNFVRSPSFHLICCFFLLIIHNFLHVALTIYCIKIIFIILYLFGLTNHAVLSVIQIFFYYESSSFSLSVCFFFTSFSVWIGSILLFTFCQDAFAMDWMCQFLHK